MIKKASDMNKNESGIIENISGYKSELECMGITQGCIITRLSDKNDEFTVLSKKDNPEKEIILINSVASEILVEIPADDKRSHK